MLTKMTKDGKCGDYHESNVADMQAHGWVILRDESPSEDTGKVAIAKGSLEDLLDSRAVLALESIGIETPCELLERARKNIKEILDLPYVTRRTIKSVREAVK